MALPGSGMVISASTNGSSWTAIDELNRASMKVNGVNVDITKFLDTYRGRIQTIKDTAYSLGGFWDKDDTNGQVAIRAALAGNTAIYVKFTVDGTNGWTQQVKVSDFSIDGEVEGAVEVGIELEGTGTVTAIP